MKLRCITRARKLIARNWPQVPRRATRLEGIALVAVTWVCELPEYIGAYKVRGWLLDRIFSRGEP